MDLSSQSLSIRKKWEGGQYDVRMIGSMVLQPAFVSSVNPVTVTGFLTDDMLKRTGKSFAANNDYGAFPDSTHLLPLNVKYANSITDPSSVYFSFSCPSILNSVLSYQAEKTKVALVYADCDDDSTTFQSSWANLDLGSNKECAKIKAAYLYWIGTKGNGVSAYGKYPGSATMKSFPGGLVGGLNSTFNRVKFKIDSGNYIEVQADGSFVKSYDGGPDYQYLCYLDLTKHLLDNNPSKITVANVQSNSKSIIPLSGWSLVVIYTYLNCPSRQIVLFDGLDWIKYMNSYKDYGLNNLQAPSTANFKSYLGVGVLDGENMAPEILSMSSGVYKQYTIPVTKLDGTKLSVNSECNFETLDFCAGGDTVKINPFATDQPSYRMADGNGVPYTKPQPTKQQACGLSSYESLDWLKAIDGVSSSKITTYDEVKNTNGNKIQRMPDLSNTMGFDLHHFRLPQGAISNGASLANMRVKSGAQGGTAVFLAYIAIETLQPLLQLSMQANKQSVDFNSKEISYTLKIFNNGGKATNPNEAYIIDSLDSSIQSIKDFQVLSSSNGLNASLVTGDVQLNPLTSKKYLKINVLDSIPPIDIVTNKVAVTDTVIIQFTAVIKDELYSLWRSKCRRTVKNLAWVYFRDVNNQEVSNVSNGDACNLNNTAVPVQVSDSVFENYDKRYNLAVGLDLSVYENTSTKLKAVLQKILTDSLLVYGLPTSDVAKMLFYDADSVVISDGVLLDINSPLQNFSAVLNLDGSSCSETYTVKLYLGAKLNVNCTPKVPSCFAKPDGKIALVSSGGFVGDSVQVSLYAGSYSIANPVPSNIQAIKQFVFNSGQAVSASVGEFDSLSVGSYTVVTYSKSFPLQSLKYDTITISNPILDTIKIQGNAQVCAGKYTALNALPSRLSDTNVYNWESSVDSLAWLAISDKASSINVLSPDSVLYYRATTQVNNCSARSKAFKLRVIPKRAVTISPELAYVKMSNQLVGQSFTAQVSGSPDIFTYNWYYSYNDSVSWNPISTSTFPGKYTGVNTNVLTISNYVVGMNNYRYRVEVQDSYGCEALAHAKLLVSDNLSVSIQTLPPTCSYINNGKAIVSVSKGNIGQAYKIRVFKGSSTNDSILATQEPLDSLTYIGTVSLGMQMDTLKNLTSGVYTVQVKEPGTINQYYFSFNIASVTPVAVSIIAEETEFCKNERAYLTANLLSAPNNSNVKYSWEKSVDKVLWTQIYNNSRNSITNVMDTTSYFRATAFAGSCSSSSNILKISVLKTPVLDILPSDTACYKFDLHNFQIKELSGLPNTKLSLHRTKPKSVLDNSSLIREDNYSLVVSSVIYARMSVQNRCYGIDSGEVFIKPMDECYPIVVPMVFSPDGDGVNDKLEISGLEEYEDPRITIYDANGDIVFEGTKEDFRYPNAWDGMYLGHKLPQADYWYLIKAKEIKHKIGHFSLVRGSRYR